jgi:hypothetical protein
MFLKGRTGKVLHMILIVSIISMWTISYIPIAHADESNQTNDPTAAEGNQLSNTLTKLEIEGIPLDQAFLADVSTYSATVENEVKSVQLLVETNDPESLITVNDQPFTNGSQSPLLLQNGENQFVITVNDHMHPTNTYALTITRKQSNNNLLKTISLSIGDLSPKFDSAVSKYSVEVANDVDSVVLSPEALENTASIRVNDSLLKNGRVTVQLPVGMTDIIILLTAENGDKKTYTIQITRLPRQGIKPPSSATISNPNAHGNFTRNTSVAQNSLQQNNGTIQKTNTATLSALTVSTGSWDTTFSTDQFTYHLEVSSDAASVTIDSRTANSGATISIEGGSNTIQLPGNKTVISILVTKGEDRKTYVLVFDKKGQLTETTTEPTPQSTDSSLSSTSRKVTSTPSTTPTAVSTNKSNLVKSKTSTSFWGRFAALLKKIF